MMRRSSAFSLVELLVVVAILAVLLGIMAPSLRRAKELTRRAICLTNMKHTVQGCMGYAAETPGPTPRRGVEDLVRSDKF